MAERPYLIGLTGGVASGKSVVADTFRREGLPVINLDDLGRDLIRESAEVQAELAKIYGPIALTSGKLDALKMRGLLFSSQTIKTQVEKFLHPLIWGRFVTKIKELTKSGHSKIVCEAALLVESGYHKQMDKLIVVSAPKETQLTRLMARDRISEKLAMEMIASQQENAEKERLADEILLNDSTLESLQAAAKNLIQKL